MCLCVLGDLPEDYVCRKMSKTAHVRTIRKQNQQNFDWELSRLMKAAVETLLGKTKASEAAGFRKAKGARARKLA